MDYLPQVDDVFADLAIAELYELHMARAVAGHRTEEEGALEAQRIQVADPDGFLRCAELLLLVSIDTRAEWIKDEGIGERAAQQKWEMLMGIAPEVVIGMVKNYFLRSPTSPTDQAPGQQSS